MTDRIRWEPTDFGGFTGHVGTGNLEVFRLWLRDRETEWTLAADLPGVSLYGNNPDELKADAERWLAKFIGIVGTVFPDEPAKQRKSRAWHADWAEAGRDRDGNAILKYKPTGGRYKILPIEEC